MESPVIWQEIDYHSEITINEVIGKGAFGVVSRAQWRGKTVAVKLIESANEKKEFMKELKQLTRVNHPNIVKLYGACTRQPVCLVMEFAEGGSLYTVLHGPAHQQPEYSAVHAIGWCMQAATGVAYLHNMKPKALIHRDLKPPNLLLVQNGRRLKICDFGTACENHTYMTNAKGSAAWMAPEVFEGSHYDEKCDVFSWGIILWEVLTRRKPFDDMGGPAFRIMWMVHQGKRPPPVANCPPPLHVLMTSCWHQIPARRPSMNEVVRIMTHVEKFFGDDLPPLRYPGQENKGTAGGSMDGVYETPPYTHGLERSYSDAVLKTMFGPGEQVTSPQPAPQHPTPPVVEVEPHRSAPPSLASSREHLVSLPVNALRPTPFRPAQAGRGDVRDGGAQQQQQQDFATKRALGHRRSGSHGTPFVVTGNNMPPPSSAATAANSAGLLTPISPHARGHRRTGSHGSPFTAPAQPTDLSHPPQQRGGGAPEGAANRAEVVPPRQPQPENRRHELLSRLMVAALDSHLQPLSPCPTSERSVAIYNEHCRLAEEFVRMRTEMEALQQRRHQLQEELERRDREDLNSIHITQQYSDVLEENSQLRAMRDNLQEKLSTLVAKEVRAP